MGLSNPIHIAFVLMLLLLVFGAKRLPEIGRSLGSGMRGFKDSLTDDHEQPVVTAQPPLVVAQQQEHPATPAEAPPETTIVTPLHQPRTPAA
jgi:sec-independent protein translocase protein TatA